MMAEPWAKHEGEEAHTKKKEEAEEEEEAQAFANNFPSGQFNRLERDHHTWTTEKED